MALLVRSVVDGLRSVPAAVKQSATAVGYGWFARLVRVELPLAMPVIFAGLRVVTVSNIALVSVGAVIGGGALGQLFDRGLNSAFLTPIIVGLVLSLLLALVADAMILLIQRGSPALGAGTESWHEPVELPAGPGELDRARAGSSTCCSSTWLTPSAAVAIAAVIGIPLGILIGHTGRGSFLVIGLSNAARAIPSLGLLVLVVILLGTGFGPIVGGAGDLGPAADPDRHRGRGVREADQEAVHAARALGMTAGQIVGKVEWPLALPLVISGLRSATLQVVATATIAGVRLRRRPRPAADQRSAQRRLLPDVRRGRAGRGAGHPARSAARRCWAGWPRADRSPRRAAVRHGCRRPRIT